MNTVKDKLGKGQVSLGGWLQIGHAAVAEMMAAAGFDWVALDAEHGQIDVEAGANVLGALRGGGAVPLVRVQSNDEITIRRWLDAGAAGIIVPLVNNAQQAADAVAAAKYPPMGRRGFGFCRANIGGRDFTKYIASANDDILVVVQIEHVEAVKNIDSILEVEGVDAAFIGPYDLSGSMGLVGQLDHEDVTAAIRTMLQACKKHRKAAGIHVVAVDAAPKTADYARDGFTFIALSIDTVMLNYCCDRVLDTSGVAHGGANG